MDLVAGPMGNLSGKLLQLLQDEYKLQKGVKAQVKYLADELESTNVALCKVAQVPYDQLDPQVKIWASEAREASYDMEDILDTFFVRVDGCQQPTDGYKGKVHHLKEMMEKMFDKISLKKTKARREISIAIEDIKKQVDEIAKRRDRCKVDTVVSNYATPERTDPRKKVHIIESDLVAIDKPMDTLIKMLTDDDASDKKVKLVSIVGSGGLGKTTLTKLVYKKLTKDMNIDCKAFVSVGQKPKLMKVLRDILFGLDRERYMNKTNFNMLEEEHLKEEIQDFLKEKRYFIIIDDVWEVSLWNDLKIVFEDNNLGSKIMITTRHSDVADLVPCTYNIQALCPESSKILFYGRIFGSQDGCPPNLRELSENIMKKCDGVPLAIITIASLLASKEGDITEWQEACNSIGYGISSKNNMHNDMRKILSLSYDDLSAHMKTCFLYLSRYPEDYKIDRDGLIWRWVSEGFIQPEKKGDDLFELGKSYFNDLINRSLLLPIEGEFGEINAFRVHDMILDLICFLSRGQNFITASDDIEQELFSKSKKIRRLSLGNTTWPKKDISHVRSIAVFASSIDSMPSFSCFHMLRVLDLEGTYLSDDGGSKLYVGNLIHLRYLGLNYTGLEVLPGGIEKLQFLQVLKMDPHALDTIALPQFIFGLRRLMCLEGVHCTPQQANLLRNLTSLQVLSKLYLHEDPAGTMEALSYLTRLTTLVIIIHLEDVQSTFDALMNSLGKLSRLQSLQIRGSYSLISWKRWSPPPHHLTSLKVGKTICLQMLPKWISHTSLIHLVTLWINVHIVRAEDIQTLGTLPKLFHLRLEGDKEDYLNQPAQKIVVSIDAFPRLSICETKHVVIAPFVLTRGAMLHIKRIEFYIRPMDFFSNCGLDFDKLAMDHLPSLQEVVCIFTVHDEMEMEKAVKLEEAVKHAIDVHPNHPRLRCLL